MATSDTRTNHVIDSIDTALRDVTVSGDAMRWTPDPPPPVQRARVVNLGVAYGRPSPAEMEAFNARMANLAAELGRHFNAFIEALNRAAAQAATSTANLVTLLEPIGEWQDEPDPRQRALDARRNRGTGPAPRRLDGRR